MRNDPLELVLKREAFTLTVGELVLFDEMILHHAAEWQSGDTFVSLESCKDSNMRGNAKKFFSF